MSSSSDVEIVSVTPAKKTNQRSRSRRFFRPNPNQQPEVICLDDDSDDNEKTEPTEVIPNMGSRTSKDGGPDTDTAFKEEDHANEENLDVNALNSSSNDNALSAQLEPNTNTGENDPVPMDVSDDENHNDNCDDADDDDQFKDSNDGQTRLQPDANIVPPPPPLEDESSDDLEELSASEDEDESPPVPVASNEFDQVPQPLDDSNGNSNSLSQPENASEMQQPVESNLPQKEAAAEVGGPPERETSKFIQNAMTTETGLPNAPTTNQEHVGSSAPEIGTRPAAEPTENSNKDRCQDAAVEIARPEHLTPPAEKPKEIPSNPLLQSTGRVDRQNSVKETTTPKRKACELDRRTEDVENEQESPTAKRQKTSGTRTAVCDLPEAKTDLEAVSRKWQMASVVHFFATFYAVLPVEDVIGEENELDVSAARLERAVAEPDSDPDLVYLLRDIIAVLLLALKRVSAKRARTHWFESLCSVAWARSKDFVDTCGSDAMRVYDGNGTLFLVDTPWPNRLAILLTLCDIAAEESDCIRNCIVPESAVPVQGDNSNPDTEGRKINMKRARMEPFGRCSEKRWYFRVGPKRIYSGFKRKGNGNLRVECDSSESMQVLIDRLAKSNTRKDIVLAQNIKDSILPQVVEKELEEKKKAQRTRELKTLQMDSWAKKGKLRPRRRKQVYYV